MAGPVVHASIIIPHDLEQARDGYMSAIALIAALVYRHRPTVRADVLADARTDITYLRDIQPLLVRQLGRDLVSHWAECLLGTAYFVDERPREVSLWYEPDSPRST